MGRPIADIAMTAAQHHRRHRDMGPAPRRESTNLLALDAEAIASGARGACLSTATSSVPQVRRLFDSAKKGRGIATRPGFSQSTISP